MYVDLTEMLVLTHTHCSSSNEGVITPLPPSFFPDTLSKTLCFYAKSFLIAARASFAVILMQKRGP